MESTQLLLCVQYTAELPPPTPTPSLPSLSLPHPSHPCSLPADCSISQVIKDDYRLQFCDIIILWAEDILFSILSTFSVPCCTLNVCLLYFFWKKFKIRTYWTEAQQNLNPLLFLSYSMSVCLFGLHFWCHCCFNYFASREIYRKIPIYIYSNMLEMSLGALGDIEVNVWSVMAIGLQLQRCRNSLSLSRLYNIQECTVKTQWKMFRQSWWLVGRVSHAECLQMFTVPAEG